MTDKKKEAIFLQWCNHQKRQGQPIPEYGYKAYTDEVFALWVSVMTPKKEVKR